MDKKVIGPSIRDIAQKYKGDPGAMSRLVDRAGRRAAGSGHGRALLQDDDAGPSRQRAHGGDRGLCARGRDVV